MKAEEARQATTQAAEPARNAGGAGPGAETEVTTRRRTKAEWEQGSGLMERVCERANLMLAYQRVVKNKGAAGVDGQTFADIETYGVERWVGELADELRNKRYLPQAVRRVYIAKPDGRQRPLGIPTVRDRVVQMAALLVLEPIFEADMQPEQYAYRTERGAWDALKHTLSLLKAGHGEVLRTGERVDGERPRCEVDGRRAGNVDDRIIARPGQDIPRPVGRLRERHAIAAPIPADRGQELAGLQGLQESGLGARAAGGSGHGGLRGVWGVKGPLRPQCEVRTPTCAPIL